MWYEMAEALITTLVTIVLPLEKVRIYCNIHINHCSAFVEVILHPDATNILIYVMQYLLAWLSVKIFYNISKYIFSFHKKILQEIEQSQRNYFITIFTNTITIEILYFSSFRLTQFIDIYIDHVRYVHHEDKSVC